MINKFKALGGYLRALKVLNDCRHIQQIYEKVRVVFVMQYLPSWEKVKILYDKMLLDDKIEPFILAIPMEQKHEDIRYSKFERNETYDFLIEQGYQVINGLGDDGNWLDLRSLKPDYVFYTRPYNSFLPDEYKSSSVAKYARICVVMYGMPISSIGQCGINRDFFSYVSCYFAEDEEIKQIFMSKFYLGIMSHLQKVVVVGSPVLETVYEQKKEQTDIWNFGKDEHGLKVLWLPRWSTDKKEGGSNFFKYKDALLEHFTKSHNKLLIRPHPLMFQNFINTGEWSEEEKNKFIKICYREENIELDLSEIYTTTMWSSDILIADITSIIPEYFLTGKPIIYCYPEAEIIHTELMKKMLQSCYVVHNKKELFQILDNLENNIDPLKIEREKQAKSMVQKYALGCSKKIISLVAFRKV